MPKSKKLTHASFETLQLADTAIVRNGPDWLEIDDEEVHLIGPNDVLNARRDAYMLWYRLQ